MKYPEECKGCAILSEPHDPYVCTIRQKKLHKICPCIKCIIKPVCDTACKEQIDLVRFSQLETYTSNSYLSNKIGGV